MNEGILNLLRKLVTDKQIRVRRVATFVLLKITRTDEKCRLENVKSGLLSWMYSMIEEQAMAIQCLLTLCDISESPTARKFIETKAVLDILALIYSRQDDDTHEFKLNKRRDDAHDTDTTNSLRDGLCIQIIYNLSCTHDFLADLVHARAHGFLMSLLPHITTPALQVRF